MGRAVYGRELAQICDDDDNEDDDMDIGRADGVS